MLSRSVTIALQDLEDLFGADAPWTKTDALGIVRDPMANHDAAPEKRGESASLDANNTVRMEGEMAK